MAEEEQPAPDSQYANRYCGVVAEFASNVPVMVAVVAPTDVGAVVVTKGDPIVNCRVFPRTTVPEAQTEVVTEHVATTR
jgi:hypothetical protein